ncbi:hypothetical protein EV426DRAFT_711895 [Tirmania nivea]|nr:hypothetical protein EV426DRAFT_711895 [Tirmania nivea]
MAAWVGRRMLRPDIVTTGGIRQAFPMRRYEEAANNEVEPRGAAGFDIYSHGSRAAAHKVGRAEDPLCGLCEEGVAQNAAHLLSCPGVADVKGRRWEQTWEDPEWCEKLAEAVRG